MAAFISVKSSNREIRFYRKENDSGKRGCLTTEDTETQREDPPPTKPTSFTTQTHKLYHKGHEVPRRGNQALACGAPFWFNDGVSGWVEKGLTSGTLSFIREDPRASVAVFVPSVSLCPLW